MSTPSCGTRVLKNELIIIIMNYFSIQFFNQNSTKNYSINAANQIHKNVNVFNFQTGFVI